VQFTEDWIGSFISPTAAILCFFVLKPCIVPLQFFQVAGFFLINVLLRVVADEGTNFTSADMYETQLLLVQQLSFR
jgi:hypothetical protein